MFIRVYGIFAPNFCTKKVPRSSRLVLGVQSHGPTGCKIGAVHMCLPVWRELKLWSNSSFWNPVSTFTCAFPFEGNWNSLCRLPWWRWDLSFTCAFPFEGNWNQLSPSSPSSPSLNVHMCLPVWRELKHFRFRSNCAALPCSHVPSRLKGIETRPRSVMGTELAWVHMCLPVWRELKLFLRIPFSP